MLIIGSRALSVNGLIGSDRPPKDWDIVGSFKELQTVIKEATVVGIVRSEPLDADHWHILTKDGMHTEFEIAWEGTSGHALLELEGATTGIHFASLSACLALKLSHRYKKNSPHFLKTLNDVRRLRDVHGVTLTPELEAWLPHREAETYVYSHPKLNVSKAEFFTDDVPYIYDHDSIHRAIALNTRPAYMEYMADGAAVMTSKAKFFDLPHEICLNGVYEEACVLALERSQIPYGLHAGGTVHPRKSFLMALEKVCTSITSGWFREFAWENYHKVLDLYEEKGEDDYLERFLSNESMLLPHKGE
jgi:hypothetical protein